MNISLFVSFFCKVFSFSTSISFKSESGVNKTLTFSKQFLLDYIQYSNFKNIIINKYYINKLFTSFDIYFIINLYIKECESNYDSDDDNSDYYSTDQSDDEPDDSDDDDDNEYNYSDDDDDSDDDDNDSDDS